MKPHNVKEETKDKILGRMVPGKSYTQGQLRTSRQALLSLVKAGLISRSLNPCARSTAYPEVGNVYRLR